MTVMKAAGSPLLSSANCVWNSSTVDRLDVRHYRYLPLLATLAVFFVYEPRRCECPKCGVKVEMVPWADGKSPMTRTLQWYLADWAKSLSWKEVAQRFHVSWAVVYGAVKMAVEWGLEHRNLDRITAIGVDELARRKGHVYFTLVYQIDHGCRRLPWIGRDRTAQSFHGLREHQALLLNWFKAREAFAKGATEGLNDKARVITRRSYGFRTDHVAEIAMFHAMGKLPVPGWVAHRFR
jgi:transposase